MIQELNVTAEEVRLGVARVAASQTFRGKETLQRLLAYLADRTMDRSAGSLKEYTIGVEVFGKPANYDPQEDASVRVQIGRLRQKLEEYARTEGVNDPLLIELPKRQFALQFHSQPMLPASLEAPETIKSAPQVIADQPPQLASQISRQLSWAPLLVGGLLGSLLVALVWAGWSFRQSRATPSAATTTAAELPAELNELWQPFLASRRPLTMAMTMRPFLRYDRGVIWDWRLTSLDGEAHAARLREIQQQLKTERLVPWEKNYTGFGEAMGIFLLTKFFERQERALQLKRSDALTWEEISEQDVIFVGAGKAGVPFERIPIQLAFEQKNNNRILNLHPRPSELPEFVTPAPDPKDFMQQEDYALISVVPGLHGQGEIMAFGASSSSGLWAAVEFMTEPRYARELLARLKGSAGKLPRHYQVIIHARFQSFVPVEIKYVAHREL